MTRIPTSDGLNAFSLLPENAAHHLDLASSTDGAQLRVLGLVASKDYWVRARADNGIGNTRRPGIWRDSPDRGIFRVKTDAMSMPSAPSAPVVLKTTGGMVELGWNNPEDMGGADLSGLDENGNKDNKPDLSGFRIFFRKVTDPPSDFDLIYEVSGDVYTKQIGYLESETTYEFRVRAMNPVALCSDVDADGQPLPGRPEDPIAYVSEGTVVTTLAPTVPGPPTTKEGQFWVKGKDSDGLTTGGKLTLEWTVTIRYGRRPTGRRGFRAGARQDRKRKTTHRAPATAVPSAQTLYRPCLGHSFWMMPQRWWEDGTALFATPNLGQSAVETKILQENARRVSVYRLEHSKRYTWRSALKECSWLGRTVPRVHCNDLGSDASWPTEEFCPLHDSELRATSVARARW